MKWALSVVGVVVAAALIVRLKQDGSSLRFTTAENLPEWMPLPLSDWENYLPDSNDAYQGEADQSPDFIDKILANIDPSIYMPVNVSQDVAARNERAFLDMIAYSEGTSGPDGYRTMFGYRLFQSFADHPRQYFPFTDGAGRTLTTSAAGRYQFLARTWDGLRNKLNLPDFSPASQDLGALELIRERGALNDVRAGRTAAAINKVRKVWASLPGAGYAQPERDLQSLLGVYASAGGTFEGQA